MARQTGGNLPTLPAVRTGDHQGGGDAGGGVRLRQAQQVLARLHRAAADEIPARSQAGGQGERPEAAHVHGLVGVAHLGRVAPQGLDHVPARGLRDGDDVVSRRQQLAHRAAVTAAADRRQRRFAQGDQVVHRIDVRRACEDHRHRIGPVHDLRRIGAAQAQDPAVQPHVELGATEHVRRRPAGVEAAGRGRLEDLGVVRPGRQGAGQARQGRTPARVAIRLGAQQPRGVAREVDTVAQVGGVGRHARPARGGQHPPVHGDARPAGVGRRCGGGFSDNGHADTRRCRRPPAARITRRGGRRAGSR